jgi:transposase
LTILAVISAIFKAPIKYSKNLNHGNILNSSFSAGARFTGRKIAQQVALLHEKIATPIKITL